MATPNKSGFGREKPDLRLAVQSRKPFAAAPHAILHTIARKKILQGRPGVLLVSSDNFE
jgi:hypothetical protein